MPLAGRSKPYACPTIINDEANNDMRNQLTQMHGAAGSHEMTTTGNKVGSEYLNASGFKGLKMQDRGPL